MKEVILRKYKLTNGIKESDFKILSQRINKLFNQHNLDIRAVLDESGSKIKLKDIRAIKSEDELLYIEQPFSYHDRLHGSDIFSHQNINAIMKNFNGGDMIVRDIGNTIVRLLKASVEEARLAENEFYARLHEKTNNKKVNFVSKLKNLFKNSSEENKIIYNKNKELYANVLSHKIYKDSLLLSPLCLNVMSYSYCETVVNEILIEKKKIKSFDEKIKTSFENLNVEKVFTLVNALINISKYKYLKIDDDKFNLIENKAIEIFEKLTYQEQIGYLRGTFGQKWNDDLSISTVDKLKNIIKEKAANHNIDIRYQRVNLTNQSIDYTYINDFYILHNDQYEYMTKERLNIIKSVIEKEYSEDKIINYIKIKDTDDSLDIRFVFPKIEQNKNYATSLKERRDIVEILRSSMEFLIRSKTEYVSEINQTMTEFVKEKRKEIECKLEEV